MVATVLSFAEERNRALTGEGWDGVVRVSVGSYYGTGSLLFDGRAVLTAAHLFDTPDGVTTVSFDTAKGSQTLGVSKVLLHTAYDNDGNNDLALLWLDTAAPLAAERYDIYRDSNELLQDFTFVGYGVPGTGRTGIDELYDGPAIRQWAKNRFDTDPATMKQLFGYEMAWKPLSGSQLMADFDNGLPAQDALGRFMGIHDRGLGWEEGLLTGGDSGGPAFLAGKVAGIASYGVSLTRDGVKPDADGVTNNASFGELSAWQKVSYYQQWIDQNMRAQYLDAPAAVANVKTSITEGNDQAVRAYFLLEFSGVRSSPDQLLSVDYRTRDGTAKAGEDYFATSGKLVLYPGEDKAVIPVEIKGDIVQEGDETFFLDVFNPVGGSFGVGIVTLTAMRTIIDDDVWLPG